MYDIKSIESGEKEHENIITNYYQKNSSYTNISSKSPLSAISSTILITSSSTPSLSSLSSSSSSSSSSASSTIENSASVSVNNNMLLRRRRIFQRQACLLSVMAAFSLGLALGVFIPMIGMSAAFTSSDLYVDRSNKTIIANHQSSANSNADASATYNNQRQQKQQNEQNQVTEPKHPPSNFPTIYEIRPNSNYHDRNIRHTSPQIATDVYSVSFIKDKEMPAEEVFRNAFHLEQDKNSDDTMIVKKLDANDGSIKEFRVQRTSDGLFRKGPEKQLSKPSISERILSGTKEFDEVQFVPVKSKITSEINVYLQEVIKDSIYWGDLVERSLPRGYSNQDAEHWNTYVRNGVIAHLEVGCGRMQNRMVIFSDGTRACARYRQNTDQIQGELFSFYLGQLLNLTNLAPSAASVIDLETEIWSNAVQDITLAQWKSFRPVVLTKWLPNLEPAGIPTPFQPLERHLNKFDVWNITLGIDYESKLQQQQKGLLDRLGATINDDQSQKSADAYNIGSGGSADAVVSSTSGNAKDKIIFGTNNNDAASDVSHTGNDYNHQKQQNNNYGESKHDKDRLINSTILNRLIELAQWSDLIIFDYLIANLDRVVNNLYNYQWNADIMAAPAHNLAREINSQLLVFLDNESGLLHGYRLLKKYEAYHGLLLDNLCVFRQPTILALQSLKDYGVGHQLQQLFERSTSHQVRDVLPSLPDKSIKILVDRIDRVLGQVHKCRDLFSDR